MYKINKSRKPGVVVKMTEWISWQRSWINCHIAYQWYLPHSPIYHKLEKLAPQISVIYHIWHVSTSSEPNILLKIAWFIRRKRRCQELYCSRVVKLKTPPTSWACSFAFCFLADDGISERSCGWIDAAWQVCLFCPIRWAREEEGGENQVLQVGKSFKKGKSESQWREGKKIERGSHHRKRVRYILIINFLIKTNILSKVHPNKKSLLPIWVSWNGFTGNNFVGFWNILSREWSRDTTEMLQKVGADFQ